MDNLTRPEFPTTIVIFGVTGDLTERKLIPALMDLYLKNYLPDDFNIVGFARRDIGDEGLRNIVRKSLETKGHSHSQAKIDEFISKFHYSQGNFTDEEAYKKLSSVLTEFDRNRGECSNKLFYLAVPPKYYDEILDNLSKPGLYISCVGENQGWTRILVEKPFGKDLETAKRLDKKLSDLFSEKQIYRIDHYLQKETIQNILVFRFSNSIFEPIWSGEHIEKVEINLHETLGIESRGAFYDEVGALRDVGQNHILQILAAITMEDPHGMDSDHIRDSRMKVLADLKTPDETEIIEHLIRAQYKGYTEEDGVDGSSQTETYFKLEAYIDNDRWRDVPFYLESGKKMAEKVTEVKIYFKPPHTCFCPPDDPTPKRNVLTFKIQPEEGISIKFWVKKPDFKLGFTEKELSFDYSADEDTRNMPDAYEELLYDCITGNQTLFIRSDEGEAAWRYITSIMQNWDGTELIKYDSGRTPKF